MKRTFGIVTSDPHLRDQLVAALPSRLEADCVLAAGTGKEAVLRTGHRHPDALFVDLQLSDMSGIDCIATLNRQLPATRLIALCHGVRDGGKDIIQALQAGAAGFLQADPDHDSWSALGADIFDPQTVPFSSSLVPKVVQLFQPASGRREMEPLSPREAEVLRHLAEGRLYREIATLLLISPETVKTYVKRICAKLRVRGRADAVAKYYTSTLHLPALDTADI